MPEHGFIPDASSLRIPVYNEKTRKREFNEGKIDSTCRVFDEKTGKRIAGVWRTRTGNRYFSRIRNTWIGTFDTIEQASGAFEAKKKEFDQAVKKRRVREFEWVEVEKAAVSDVSDTKSGEFGSEFDEIQEPMEEEALEFCSVDTFRVSRSPESTCDQVIVQRESESNHESRNAQITSESSYQNQNADPESNQQTETVKKAAEEYSSKERVSSFMAYFEHLKKRSVWVTSDKYRGGGALGFVIPMKGGGESFMPFMDNHGFLLGEFSKVDDFLSLGNNSLN